MAIIGRPIVIVLDVVKIVLDEADQQSRCFFAMHQSQSLGKHLSSRGHTSLERQSRFLAALHFTEQTVESRGLHIGQQSGHSLSVFTDELRTQVLGTLVGGGVVAVGKVVLGQEAGNGGGGVVGVGGGGLILVSTSE